MHGFVGLGVFVFAFGGMLWANARRWRYLSRTYAQATEPPIVKRRLQSAVLLGLSGFNSLKGLLTIGIHETGISLRVLAPFSLFHAPLFIPFGDIKGWKTSWYVDAKSTELEFSQAPNVKVVMPAEQAEWIGSFADHKMALHDAAPPQGKAGRGWHVFALVHACMVLAMVTMMPTLTFDPNQSFLAREP